LEGTCDRNFTGLIPGRSFYAILVKAVKMSINAHPELPEFEYIQPTTLSEASRFLADHPGESRPLLGGTDIFVRMRDGVWHDQYLVDVKSLDGMNELSFTSEVKAGCLPGLTIGAAVNMNRVMAFPPVREHYPILAEACRWVASYQLRTRATVVGNICNASPAGDTIGPCGVLDGMLTVHHADGSFQIPLEGFFTGPGKTILKAGDIVTSVFLPLPPPGSAGAFIKLGRNNWGDLSIVAVTVFARPNHTSPSGWQFRIMLSSVAPVPLVAQAAQDYLAGVEPGVEAFKEAASLAAEACTPIDDARGSARYRKAMARKLTEKALQATWSKLGGAA
jgi:CO/xanthine dehydrogenase FAD-binding subunit